ncbi:hypothetical protein [Curtobacterium sp. MCPF17_052]|uniref:hypothetical protein n=1 Tax=Curtobacterium sp. MCPF17_052 TaxID=2175655 RepID=UPI0024DF579B|nr:hypothetical protein [Curtobacterium sp. MCPF17_052]WIB11848.1 hypothetical protein DEJ36_13310 [Curtobacterium sp. MCPF17_052]
MVHAERLDRHRSGIGADPELVQGVAAQVGDQHGAVRCGDGLVGVWALLALLVGAGRVGQDLGRECRVGQRGGHSGTLAADTVHEAASSSSAGPAPRRGRRRPPPPRARPRSPSRRRSS